MTNPNMLPDVRVLEFEMGGGSGYVPTQYAAKSLASLGATVSRVRLTHASGEDVSPVHEVFEAWLQDGKSSFGELDGDDEGGISRILDEFAPHVILLGTDGHLGFESIRKLIDLMGSREQLTGLVTVTPFGLHGPKAGWRGSNLVGLAAGGSAYYTPWVKSRRLERPLQLGQYSGELVAGAAATVSAISYLNSREHDRSRMHGDISVQDCIMSMMLLNMSWYTHEQLAPSRSGKPGRGVRPVPLRCQDGLFMLLTPQEAQWKRWVEVMGSPGWAQEPVFANRELRNQNRDAVDMLIESWAKQYTKEEIWRLGQKSSVPVFPVNTVEEVVNAPQMVARDFFRGLTFHGNELNTPSAPGNIYRYMKPIPSPSEETPLGSERQRIALSDLRILDLSWVLAAPRATTWLGYLGADVVRVESGKRLDQFRNNAPYWGGVPGPDNAGQYQHINQNKRSITIDLTHPDAAELVLSLAEHFDVVVDSFATGQMERFGLSDSALLARNPSLIIASSSGLGRTGPDASAKAYGNTIHAYAGLTGRVGYAPYDVRGANGTWADPLSGMVLAGAILAAVHQRNHTGAGVKIDLSMAEVVTFATIPDAFLDYGIGALSDELPENNSAANLMNDTFRCLGDDEWIAITLRDRRDLDRAAQALNLEGTPEVRKVHGELSRVAAQWDASKLAEHLQAKGMAAHKVLTVVDAFEESHCLERGTIVQVEDKLGRSYPIIGLPWRTQMQAGVVERPSSPAPFLGEHTEQVLREILGMSEGEIGELRARRVLE